MFTFPTLRPLFLVSSLFLATPAHALIELRFDDGEFLGYFTQIDHPSGVSFSVDPAGFASYGTGFAFGADYAQGAALEMDPGTTLTMRFGLPVNYLEFGALLNDTTDFASRVSVALYTSSGLEGLPFISPPVFSGMNERLFTYYGDGIVEAVVSFGTSFESFAPLAIDNLVAQPVPEPTTYALMAAGLLMLGGVTHRRRVLDCKEGLATSVGQG